MNRYQRILGRSLFAGLLLLSASQAWSSPPASPVTVRIDAPTDQKLGSLPASLPVELHLSATQDLTAELTIHVTSLSGQPVRDGVISREEVKVRKGSDSVIYLPIPILASGDFEISASVGAIALAQGGGG